MEMKALHALMRTKGFHYFQGMTNPNEDFIRMDFSTSVNGRGNYVGLVLEGNEKHHGFISLNPKSKEDHALHEFADLDDNGLYLLLSTHLKDAEKSA